MKEMKENISDKIVNLQKRFYELNNLFELSIIANQGVNLEDLISKISSFIKECLEIKNLEFLVVENNILVSQGYESKSLEFELDDKYLLSLFDDNKFIDVSDGDENPVYKTLQAKYHLTDYDAKYFRAFKKDDELFAVCIVGSKSNDNDFEEGEIEVLKKIFNYIEPVLLKFTKRKAQDEELKSLHKTLNNISILYNLSQAVNFIDDLKRLLKVILSKALETIGAEKGSLMLYDFSDSTLQVKVVYGLEDKKLELDINSGAVECSKLKSGEGIAGNVFVNKKSIITNLGQNDPRFMKVPSLAKTSSLLCVPLITKSEAIGVINISNKLGNKLFNKQDLEFMEALANQAAIAIDNAKLYELATKDGLTKLYIYRHFCSLLENEFKRAQRYNHVLSLLMMDIDNFKEINDTYGHPVGDQVLREISAVIVETVRKIDIPARYGGEEFSIILPETNSKDARIIAQRLRENISKIQVTTKDGGVVKPTISIGISDYPGCAVDENSLVELADVALYNAKRSGKNCVFEYTPEGCVLVENSN